MPYNQFLVTVKYENIDIKHRRYVYNASPHQISYS